MLNNPENTEEIVNELNEVEMKIKNLKTLLKNKQGRFCISEDLGQLNNLLLLKWFDYTPSLLKSRNVVLNHNTPALNYYCFNQWLRN